MIMSVSQEIPATHGREDVKETELPVLSVKALPFEEYRRIHDIAAAAYEAATPVDYRYSALALRKAVDAAINALTLKDDPGNGEAERLTRLTRPIIGIENRTPLEVFDIMADRIRAALRKGDK